MNETMSLENLETETKIEKEKSGYDFVKLMQKAIPYIMEELGFERNKIDRGNDEEKYDRLKGEFMAIITNLGKTVGEAFHNTVIDKNSSREEIREGICLAMSGGDTPNRLELKNLSEDEIDKIEKIILRRFDEYMNLNV